MSEEAEVFQTLAKPVQSILEELGFHAPTEPQKKAIPIVFNGKNLLLVACMP